MRRRPALLALAVAALAAGCGAPGVEADWRVGRLSPEWKYIVIHHSATESGCFAKFEKYHREDRGWEYGCGYHFVIGNGTDTRDGQVEVTPRWREQIHGAHTGGSFVLSGAEGKWNEISIGICLVGNFETGFPTAKQLDALVRLVRYLQDECRLPGGRVVGHNFFKFTTQCPGANFPWDEVRGRIRP